MDGGNSQNYVPPSSFYDKYIQDDENLQARVKPILNQIQENRVRLKEIHTKYGVLFSEALISYRNRLEDLKQNYSVLLSDLKNRQDSILKECNELIEEYNKAKPIDENSHQEEEQNPLDN